MPKHTQNNYQRNTDGANSISSRKVLGLFALPSIIYPASLSTSMSCLPSLPLPRYPFSTLPSKNLQSSGRNKIKIITYDNDQRGCHWDSGRSQKEVCWAMGVAMPITSWAAGECNTGADLFVLHSEKLQFCTLAFSSTFSRHGAHASITSNGRKIMSSWQTFGYSKTFISKGSKQAAPAPDLTSTCLAS